MMNGHEKANRSGYAAFGRRDFSFLLVSVVSTLALNKPSFGADGNRSTTVQAGEEEISHSCETIHQTVVFKTSRKRVYEALTNEKQFDKVVQLSAAIKSGMSLGDKPTQIAREVGGTFTLFGGHIVGRHLELVQEERIVQAWRVATWETGVYSIVRFRLSDDRGSTKLIFDHAGFPNGQGEHLASGWRGNYWEPLEKVLA